LDALMTVYPDIGMEVFRFTKCNVSLLRLILTHFSLAPLHNAQNRRQFLENLANANCFDPLNHTNWYLQSKEKIMALEVCLFFLNLIHFFFLTCNRALSY
jgi:hypothetical protein